MARNLYAGVCYCCGAYVPPGYGHFEKTRHSIGPKWRIKCVRCASGRIITDNDSCVKGVKKRLAKQKKEATMIKPINEMTYDELLERIAKADGLPYEVRAQHADRYRALCIEAGARELEKREFPIHQICDPELREYVARLIRDVDTRLFVDDKDFRKACWTILSDLMAICLIDPSKTLEFFGYKEVAEDDD